jgi:hypothetical protein
MAPKPGSTTVLAIEKQRVKPQFKTVQALVKAFEVEAGGVERGRIE